MVHERTGRDTGGGCHRFGPIIPTRCPARSGSVFGCATVGAGNRSVGFAVDQLLQLFPRRVRDLLRRNVHLVSGLRVAALPRFAPTEAEAAEPSQLDLLAAMQRVDDALENGVDDDLGSASS